MELLWIGLGAVALVSAIFIERWRQVSKLRQAGEEPGTAGSLLGAGALELQQQLQPDRKVAVIRREMQQRDRQHPEHRPARPGEGRPERDAREQGASASDPAE